MSESLEIPSLICFVMKKRPEDDNLGLHVRQGCDNAVEVAKVSPDGPAALTPLEPGVEILSINDHRVRSAQRCAEMLKHYAERESEIEIVASVGPRPNGALYVLIKREVATPIPEPILGDGSFEGLFLKEQRNRVRVTGFGPDGILSKAKINKGDILLSIDGQPLNCIDDCKKALREASRQLIPILTYNVFRRFRSSIMVMSCRQQAADTSPEQNGSDTSRGKCVGDLYSFGPTIGSGAFSVVKKCTLKATGDSYAVKIVNRASLTKGLELALKDEVSILNELNHKHIMSLFDTFATINHYYLVTEYLDGGELFDRIVQKTTYTEMEARDVCKILFGAIQYCHEKRICHRDLKPENLLLQNKQSDLELKIADFGFARRAPTEDSLQTVCGSPGYVSPEILRREPYGTKTDMWSLGVIIFILIGGYPPFSAPQQEVQFDNIKNARYKFIDKYWSEVTIGAKSLIASLLCTDPQKRISAEEALMHPWMRADSRKLRRSSLLSSIEKMKQFNTRRKFKSAVKSVMFINKVMDNSDEDCPTVNAVFVGRNKRSSLLVSSDEECSQRESVADEYTSVDY